MLRKKFDILVTYPEFHPAALKLLEEKCNITICKKSPLDREEVLKKCKDMDGILWATHDKLDAAILNAAGSRLKVISTMSEELDFVDVEELKRRRIKLGHTPIVMNRAAADIAIGLMISAARRFHEGRQKIETSTWETGHINWMLGQEIAGSIVGFIMFGAIAQAVARRLRGFNVRKIIYFNKGAVKKSDINAHEVRFEEVVKQSDFLVIACPLTSDTKDLINESVFNKMKPNCVLVSISHGEIVNRKDLFNALKNGKIWAAGIDALSPEELPQDDPLLSLPNCVVTPHLVFSTYSTTKIMAKVAASNVINGMMDSPMVISAY